MKIPISLLALFFCLSINFCFSQSFSVKGTVTDQNTHSPIKYVFVQLIGSDGSNTVTKTDSLGNYMFGSAIIKPNTSYILSPDGSEQGYVTTNKGSFTTTGINGSKVFTIDLELYHNKNEGGHFPVVRFDKDKSGITQSADSTGLDGLLMLLNTNPGIVIEIDGHASAGENYPIKLSEARVNVCKQYLISKGIDSARLVAKGWGNKHPLSGVSPNDSVNRRVEFRVLRFDYTPKK